MATRTFFKWLTMSSKCLFWGHVSILRGVSTHINNSWVPADTVVYSLRGRGKMYGQEQIHACNSQWKGEEGDKIQMYTLPKRNVRLVDGRVLCRRHKYCHFFANQNLQTTFYWNKMDNNFQVGLDLFFFSFGWLLFYCIYVECSQKTQKTNK